LLELLRLDALGEGFHATSLRAAFT
jgi:hypothetical protein